MSDLDRFQEALLTALADGRAPADVQRDALDTAPDEQLAAWVASWEPELVDLAGVLVRTWAYRATPPSGTA